MLYNPEDFYKNKKKIKKHIILSCSLFLLGLIADAVLAIFVNDQTATLFKFISLFILLFAGWYLVYSLTQIFELRRQNKFLVMLQYSTNVHVSGTIKENDKKITISKYESTIQVVLEKENKDKIFAYWNIKLGECPLEINKKYELVLFNNFIISYKEDLGNEEN